MHARHELYSFGSELSRTSHASGDDGAGSEDLTVTGTCSKQLEGLDILSDPESPDLM